MDAPALDLEDARSLTVARVEPLPSEDVPLSDALGRRLSLDIRAGAPLQGFDNSAMDGFAVRAADTDWASAESPAELPVAGESRAGSPSGDALLPGQAVAISTGAKMPAGADAVVRVEDTSRDGDRVLIRAAASPGLNVRRAGEDIEAGAVALPAGTVIGAAEAGVLAATGTDPVPCSRRPRVAVITSGDELVQIGRPLGDGAVYDSNSHTVAALVTLSGGEVISTGWVPDDRARTEGAIEPALGADVVVICGGVSVGEHDHVKQALESLGVEQDFWRVALKPGGPVWFGHRDRTLVFGLPGNPVSVMVTFTLLVRPVLAALTGGTAEPLRTEAVLGADVPKKPGRAHAIRCRLRLTREGWVAEPAPRQGSHVMSSMLGAECLALLPAQSGDAVAGTRVDVELLPGAAVAPW